MTKKQIIKALQNLMDNWAGYEMSRDDKNEVREFLKELMENMKPEIKKNYILVSGYENMNGIYSCIDCKSHFSVDKRDVNFYKLCPYCGQVLEEEV